MGERRNTMNECLCPSQAQLEGYVCGKLDAGTHGVIDNHVDACPTCQRTVETLDGLAQTAFPFLQQAVGQKLSLDDPPLRHLAEQVKELGCQPAHSGREAVAEAGKTVPTVLGNYELLEPIGAGGMGRVFKAYHRRMKRLVALKVLAPDLIRSEAA